jgi:FkbM family methyltransferase
MKFYSQNGEDFILNEFFKDKKDGFFVEIGCIDGKRFSNTLAFEEKGWKGLCIEAHAEYIDLLKKNRPNSIICHCAAAEKDDENCIFYANARGSLSTLDPSKEELWKKRYSEYFSGFEKQKIQKRRLDSLFRQYNIKDIDILSIDVEGYETEVLKGLDFSNFRPKVIVAEADTKDQEQQIDRILLSHGYYKSIRLVSNIFYLAEKSMRRKIKGESFEVELIHTEHPLDNTGDIVTKKRINIKSYV